MASRARLIESKLLRLLEAVNKHRLSRAGAFPNPVELELWDLSQAIELELGQDEKDRIEKIERACGPAVARLEEEDKRKWNEDFVRAHEF